jgi:hypothetical protein
VLKAAWAYLFIAGMQPRRLHASHSVLGIQEGAYKKDGCLTTIAFARQLVYVRQVWAQALQVVRRDYGRVTLSYAPIPMRA